VQLEPLALIARLAALVPPPKRHLTRYFGVLSWHASSCSQVVPAPAKSTPPPRTAPDEPAGKSGYIPWAELLRRTFGFELLCSKCKPPLRLIALIKTHDVAKKILVAMHLPTDAPDLHPARPPPHDLAEADGEDRAGDDWLN
jgi:hypothetical protein